MRILTGSFVLIEGLIGSHALVILRTMSGENYVLSADPAKWRYLDLKSLELLTSLSKPEHRDAKEAILSLILATGFDAP